MKILSLAEVCEHLKISVQTGRNRLSKGAPMPPSFRTGRRRLFILSEVENWLREMASKSASQQDLTSAQKESGVDGIYE